MEISKLNILLYFKENYIFLPLYGNLNEDPFSEIDLGSYVVGPKL